jgi:hypothetical protein
MYVRREPAIFPLSNLSTEERRSTAHGYMVERAPPRID